MGRHVIKLCGVMLLLALCYMAIGGREWPGTDASSTLSDQDPPPAPPPWLKRSLDDARCPAVKDVAFLKTHKCASSAVQNIFLRYGEKHDLLFALPKHNYFGGGTRYFHPDMLLAEVQNRLGFNIYAIHSKWNMTTMANYMKPTKKVFVAIVREPTDLFMSLFTYSKLEEFAGGNISEYVKQVGINGPRKAGYVGYNQMTWDFGLPQGQFENMTAINSLITQADGLFDLVMVAERMPESLMLLRRLLCATIDDVVVLQVNARTEEFKNKNRLDDSTRALLRQRLAPDYLLYEHFRHKFDRLVQSYGHAQMQQDMAEWEQAMMKRKLECGFHELDGSMMKELPALHRNQVFGYTSESKDPVCKAIIRSEVYYLNLLRNKQMKTVLKTLNIPNLEGSVRLDDKGIIDFNRNRLSNKLRRPLS